MRSAFAQISETKIANLIYKNWQIFKLAIKLKKIGNFKKYQASNLYQQTIYKNFFFQLRNETLKNNEKFM